MPRVTPARLVPNGKDGAAGQSVTGAAIAANGACGKKTGVKYTLGATTNVCNGEDGETGFTETLPLGKTETGTGTTPTINVIKSNGTERFGSTANCPVGNGTESRTGESVPLHLKPSDCRIQWVHQPFGL